MLPITFSFPRGDKQSGHGFTNITAKVGLPQAPRQKLTVGVAHLTCSAHARALQLLHFSTPAELVVNEVLVSHTLASIAVSLEVADSARQPDSGFQFPKRSCAQHFNTVLLACVVVLPSLG